MTSFGAISVNEISRRLRRAWTYAAGSDLCKVSQSIQIVSIESSMEIEGRLDDQAGESIEPFFSGIRRIKAPPLRMSTAPRK